jgi:hypothetical protein
VDRQLPSEEPISKIVFFDTGKEIGVPSMYPPPKTPRHLQD